MESNAAAVDSQMGLVGEGDCQELNGIALGHPGMAA